MTPHFLFVHGWALDASLWDALRGELGEQAGSVRELGYFDPPSSASPADQPLPSSASSADQPLPEAPIIAVGHSLGVMQLLDAPPAGLIGLVAINGFTCFAGSAQHPAGVPARLLHRMMQRLEQDAEATVAAFRIRCGLARIPPGRAAVPALRRGLELLCHGDGRAALRDLPVPVLALAATRDEIVPPALSAACFDRPLWMEAGGHLLPLTHALPCARALRDFAGKLA